MSCKYIFILQLPEDKTKNYVGVLDNKYNYSSFDLFVRSNVLTEAVSKQLKKKLLSLDISDQTQIVMSSEISKQHPIYIFLSIVRKIVKFNFSTVKTAKAFKRIATYHTSYRLGREFILQDYNKLYKHLMRNEDCAWMSRQIDAQLQLLSRREYRIQKILRICMYYICIKQYYLSKH